MTTPDSSFHSEIQLPQPVREVFDWHDRPGALGRLLPPWDETEIVETHGTIRNGDGVTLRIRMGLLPVRWVSRHHGFVDGARFCDTQVQGPFARWEHEHRFEPLPDGGSRLVDEIQYRLPGGVLGRLFGGRFVRRKLQRVFRYRAGALQRDLDLHQRYAGLPRKRVAVTGSSGLVGTALCSLLESGGHTVLRVGRVGSRRSGAEIIWDPAKGLADPGELEGLDAVIHLAGESIAEGRWTARKMERIRDSRIEGTRRLAEDLARLERPPAAFLTASAIGYYGDRGDEVLTETSTRGNGFLAEVVRGWESSAAPALEAGIRVAHARFGVVLSPRGGALRKMLPPFRMGAGGPVGSGRQYLSWVSLDDAVGALYHLLMDKEARGPFNVTSPRPATNREFARTLGGVLRRPALAPLPGFAARALFGRMADELLLSSARVIPERLLSSGYRFRDESMTTALSWMLGCDPSPGSPASEA